MSYTAFFSLEDSNNKKTLINIGMNDGVGNFLEEAYDIGYYGFMSSDVNYKQFNLEHPLYYYVPHCQTITEGDVEYVEPKHHEPEKYKKVLLKIASLCEESIKNGKNTTELQELYEGMQQGIAHCDSAIETNKKIILLLEFG